MYECEHLIIFESIKNLFLKKMKKKQEKEKKGKKGKRCLIFYLMSPNSFGLKKLKEKWKKKKEKGNFEARLFLAHVF